MMKRWSACSPLLNSYCNRCSLNERIPIMPSMSFFCVSRICFSWSVFGVA